MAPNTLSQTASATYNPRAREVADWSSPASVDTVAGRRREQGTIRGTKPRTRDLPAQHLKLVAHD